MFRVIDLKQYDYCSRILYYHAVLPAVRPTTYKMEAGINAHVRAEHREKRRSLRTYGLQNGERRFNVTLQNVDLGLSGEADMVVTTEDEQIPIDYKMAKREGSHFKLQLMAYGKLLELQSSLPVTRGFLYFIPQRKAIEVPFTPHLRRKLDKAIIVMEQIATKHLVPPPTSKQRRCVDCEFRRFCNDVL